MSSFEDSYKSQLQGVSQQVSRERVDGQVSAQDNMLSDTVTNLRRRPGASFAFSLNIPNATDSSILSWSTDISGKKCTLILNCVDGVIRVLDTNTYAVLATLPASSYLVTSNLGDIQTATVGDEFFIANTGKKPTLVASTARDPKPYGFFYVRAGAFSKTFEVRVQTSRGAYTATYTTPNGTGAGDAAASTPEYICQQLVAALNAQEATTGIVWWYDGAYAFSQPSPSYTSTTNVAVSSGSGSNYVIGSGSAYMRQETDLPSRLPTGSLYGVPSNGFIMSIGDAKSLKYYTYSTPKLAWLESGDWLSPSGISNVPVSVTYDGTNWALSAINFEGRYSGDSDNNPDPDFIKQGITGISSYQGRLVILAGSMVNMSASNKPRRFYRSTVTSLLDSDCINIGSAAATSAAYRYAVPFYKDLLLFSEKYQAVVPGGNQALNPRTASVLVTSTYDSDMTSKPTTVGRSLMYPAPRSADFFGVMEMLPSSTTDSQYTSFDATAHVPKYMPGRCRFGVSSSVANMVLFAPSGDRNSLIVHEYTWQEDKKVQQAWHRWTFKYPVASAYFSGQTIHIVFVKNGWLVDCTIDPRSGVLTSAAERRPYLDMHTFVDVTNRTVAYPAWLQSFDPTALSALKLSVASGPLAGEEVGFTTNGTTITTVRSFVNGRVAIGFPYRSAFSPTPPMVKDSNNVKISSNKFTVLRFMVGTNNSAQYEVTVTDSTTANDLEGTTYVGTLYFSSAELELGSARVGGDSIAVVPCRTDANSTSLVIFTEGVGELNLVSLEYVGRYTQKIKRAQVK